MVHNTLSACICLWHKKTKHKFRNNMLLLVTYVFCTHSKSLFKPIVTIFLIWLRNALPLNLSFVQLTGIKKWTRMASVAGNLRNHGLVPGRGMGLFCYARCPDGFCAPINLLNGYSVTPSLSVRRTGIEGDHQHLPTNEVKSECTCTCTPSYAFKVSTRTLPLSSAPPSNKANLVHTTS